MNNILLRTKKKVGYSHPLSHSTRRTSPCNSLQQELGHFSKKTCGNILKSLIIFVHQTLLNTKKTAVFKFLLKYPIKMGFTIPYPYFCTLLVKITLKNKK